MSTLIHGSQTGLDCCILNNVFTFYAAAEWAKQPLAGLLLNFEKAYDRVDGIF